MALKKLLIILDLNGTILERIQTRSYNSRNCYRTYDHEVATQKNRFYIWRRPYLTQFLQFCFQSPHCDVGIFSSATRRNIEPIIDTVFGKQGKQQLLFILDRDATVADTSSEQDYATKKDLQVPVWNRFPQFGPQNTIIVDDTDTKLSNHAHNLIAIPSFSHETMNEVEYINDQYLLFLQQYISYLLQHSSNDVTVAMQQLSFSKFVFDRKMSEVNDLLRMLRT